jgi:hypothetical protein
MENYGTEFFRKYSDVLEDISEKTDMQIVVEHVSAIAIDEGEAEIAAVTAALRKLANTGEGRQWAQQQGLDPDNMTDMDIRNKVIVPMGHGAADLAQYSEPHVDMGKTRQAIAALNTPVVGSFAAPSIASAMPSGRQRTTGAQGIRPATVDVDVSTGDVNTALSVLNDLSAEFPVARDLFDRGRFKDAIAQIYRRMAQGDSSTPQYQ